MVTELGSGVELDSHFDFTIDNSGDIGSAYDQSELQKDLAVRMSINLDKYIGKPPSGNLKAKVKNTARTVALADSRVTAINSSRTRIEFSDNREEITIQFSLITADGEQPLIVTV